MAQAKNVLDYSINGILTGPLEGYANLFLAGGIGDPKTGYAECPTCETEPDANPCYHRLQLRASILKWNEVCQVWQDPHGHLHTSHVLAAFPILKPRLSIVITAASRKRRQKNV